MGEWSDLFSTKWMTPASLSASARPSLKEIWSSTEVLEIPPTSLMQVKSTPNLSQAQFIFRSSIVSLTSLTLAEFLAKSAFISPAHTTASQGWASIRFLMMYTTSHKSCNCSLAFSALLYVGK